MDKKTKELIKFAAAMGSIVYYFWYIWPVIWPKKD